MPRNARLAAALGGAVRSKKLRIGFADLTAAAVTQEFAMGSLPAGSIVVGTDVNVLTAFAGTTTLEIDLGDAGGEEFVADVDLKSAGRSSAQVVEANSDGNGIAATALVTATVEDVDAATIGLVEVQVLYINASQVVPE